MAKLIRSFMLVIVNVFLLQSYGNAADKAVTVYLGKYTDNRLGDVLLSQPVDFMDSYLAAIAWAHAFSLKSPRHQWEVEGQLAKHFRGQSHWEANIVVIYRWQYFPWNNFLKTTVAVGNGLSYASEVPPLEESSTTNEGATRLLNYMLVETTFAPPQVKQWSLVVRVHHRSGVYGIFNDVEGGSNVIAAGIKYLY